MSRFSAVAGSIIIISIVASSAAQAQQAQLPAIQQGQQAPLRGSVLGVGVNFAGGGRSGSFTSSVPATPGASPSSRRFSWFDSVYPSISLTSTKLNSGFGVSYSAGLNRTESSPPEQTTSHSVSGRFGTLLSSAWDISITEAYRYTNDEDTFNTLQGGGATASTTFTFYPVATRSNTTNNTASLTLNHHLSEISDLSFNIGHSLRSYSRTSTQFAGILSDEQQAFGGVTYTRRISMGDSINVAYAGNYSARDDLTGDTHVHNVNVGFSTEILPNTRAQVSVGLAETRFVGPGGNYLGYNTTASLSRTINTDAFLLDYSQTSGQSSGLGATSDTRRVALTWSRPIGTYIRTSSNIALFDTKGTLTNTQDARGVSAAATIGVVLSARWSLQAGGQFQKYEHLTFGFSQRRVFMTLKFDHPTLFQFQ